MWRLGWRHCPRCYTAIRNGRHSATAAARVPPTPSEYPYSPGQLNPSENIAWILQPSDGVSSVPDDPPWELLNELLYPASSQVPAIPEIESSEPFVNVITDEPVFISLTDDTGMFVTEAPFPELLADKEVATTAKEAVKIPVAVQEWLRRTKVPSRVATTAKNARKIPVAVQEWLRKTNVPSPEDALTTATVICTEQDPLTAADFLKHVIKYSDIRLPVSMREYPEQLEKASRQLLRTALCVDPKQHFCGTLFSVLLAEGLVHDNTIVLEELVRHNVSIGSFEQAFTIWSSRVSSERSTAGVFILFQRAIVDSSNDTQTTMKDRIGRVMAVYDEVHSPNDSFAELVAALVSLGEVEEAEYLTSELSIPPCVFVTPLRHLAQTESLQSMEDFASLVEKKILCELKPRKMKKRAEKARQVSEPQDIDEPELAESEDDPCTSSPPPDRKFAFVVDQYTQTSPRSAKKKKRRMQKRKVDVRQVDELTTELLRAWMELAQTSSDMSAMERLKEWSQRNNVELPVHEEMDDSATRQL